MIFQVRTTRQKHNLITGVFAAWEAQEIYERWILGEAPGQEHTRPPAAALLLPTPDPPQVPLMVCAMLPQLPKEVKPWVN